MSDADDAKRVHFDDWRAIFVSALEGAAGSDKPIVRIVEDAAKIADAAVDEIAKRVPG